ncbi:MAG: hypothetical protein WB781_06625 [Candidatus Sulfotelmatobacter sp.]
MSLRSLEGQGGDVDLERRDSQPNKNYEPGAPFYPSALWRDRTWITPRWARKKATPNDPSEVARQGYDALMDGKDHIYSSSLKTKLQGELGQFVPKSVKAKQHRKAAEPKRKA